MPKITAAAELKNAIQQLEHKQAHDWLLLKEQFLTTYESLKPLNVLKNSLLEASTSVDFKDNLLSRTLGVTAGHLSRALLVGSSLNPITGFFGSLLQAGVSRAVTKNPQAIRILGASILNLFNRRKEIENENV
jgi:hypothetical protein